jgi:hypothetical protein
VTRGGAVYVGEGVHVRASAGRGRHARACARLCQREWTKRGHDGAAGLLARVAACRATRAMYRPTWWATKSAQVMLRTPGALPRAARARATWTMLEGKLTCYLSQIKGSESTSQTYGASGTILTRCIRAPAQGSRQSVHGEGFCSILTYFRN